MVLEFSVNVLTASYKKQLKKKYYCYVGLKSCKKEIKSIKENKIKFILFTAS